MNELNEKLNWCADMSLLMNPKLRQWIAEWLALNGLEPSVAQAGVKVFDDAQEFGMTVKAVRRLIAVVYRMGEAGYGKEQPPASRKQAVDQFMLWWDDGPGAGRENIRSIARQCYSHGFHDGQQSKHNPEPR